jgi:hypothetical protein
LVETGGKTDAAGGTTWDGRSHREKPGRSRGSSASILAFPADGHPREEGRAGCRRANRERHSVDRRSNARCVPRAAKTAERKKRRARAGMQAHGRTHTHGKNDNLGDSEASRSAFDEFFAILQSRFERLSIPFGFRDFQHSGRLPPTQFWKMVEGGQVVRKQKEPGFDPALALGRC